MRTVLLCVFLTSFFSFGQELISAEWEKCDSLVNNTLEANNLDFCYNPTLSPELCNCVGKSIAHREIENGQIFFHTYGDLADAGHCQICRLSTLGAKMVYHDGGDSNENLTAFMEGSNEVAVNALKEKHGDNILDEVKTYVDSTVSPMDIMALWGDGIFEKSINISAINDDAIRVKLNILTLSNAAGVSLGEMVLHVENSETLRSSVTGLEINNDGITLIRRENGDFTFDFSLDFFNVEGVCFCEAITSIYNFSIPLNVDKE